MVRRAVLIGSGLLWAGLLGLLLWREASRYTESGRQYIDSLFSEDTPVLVSESLRVREALTGMEAQLGFLETQLVYIGSNDVHVQHSLELSADRLPVLAKALIGQIVGQLGAGDLELRDVELKLDQYVSRRGGLRSIRCKARYGDDRYEFWGVPTGGRKLRIYSELNGRRLEVKEVPYEASQPFGSGDSPFRMMKGLEEGSSTQVAFLDPFTRTSVRQMIRVAGRSKVRYRGEDVECFVLNAHPVAGGDGTGYGAPVATAYLSVEDGKVLRKDVQLMMFKLSLVLEESLTARERAYRESLRAPEARPAPAPAGTPGAPGASGTETEKGGPR